MAAEAGQRRNKRSPACGGSSPHADLRSMWAAPGQPGGRRRSIGTYPAQISWPMDSIRIWDGQNSMGTSGTGWNLTGTFFSSVTGSLRPRSRILAMCLPGRVVVSPPLLRASAFARVSIAAVPLPHELDGGVRQDRGGDRHMNLTAHKLRVEPPWRRHSHHQSPTHN